MQFVPGYGAFLARSTLTPRRAKALAGAGLRHLIIQVDWQRSALRQRTAEQLRAEQEAARAAGLEVSWWAWVEPNKPATQGRRPTGPAALGRRLAALIADVGMPASVMIDAEVGGGWRRRTLPTLPEFAAVVRSVGVPRVGLTSHAAISGQWAASAFDYGAPQVYAEKAVDIVAVRRWFGTWADAGAKHLWPVLGCADEASTATQMRGDLSTLALLHVPGALWWTARQLKDDKLKAAVPESRLSPRIC